MLHIPFQTSECVSTFACLLNETYILSSGEDVFPICLGFVYLFVLHPCVGLNRRQKNPANTALRQYRPLVFHYHTDFLREKQCSAIAYQQQKLIITAANSVPLSGNG